MSHHCLLLPLLCCCHIATAQLLPVYREPHHKTILDNRYLRLLEGRVPAHDTTLPHTHTANSVVIFLSPSTFGIQVPGQPAVITRVNPGDMKYSDYGDKPVYHTVWNQTKPDFRFLVAEIAKNPPGKDTCPILTLPDVKFQWRHALVTAYDVDMPAGDTCHLPASNGGRLLIAIKGNCSTPSAGVSHPLLPDGFVFIPPHKKMEIAADNKADTRCILLEIQ